MSSAKPTTTAAPIRSSAKVTEAAQCDAAGNHDQALILLAQACKEGDAEAMTRLGKRLLVGDAAPYRPDAGADLVVRAANAGSAEAAAQLAVLAAIGMHMKQSWEVSLSALVFAAERGFAGAQGQLRVLAADRSLAEQHFGHAAAGQTLWRELAASIDLNRWHTPAPGAVLHESPLVRHFPEFAPAHVCEWMIENARGRLVPSLVYNALEKRQMVSPTRTNTWAVFNLVDSDLVSVLIQVHMCATTGLPFRQLEPATVLHYAIGEEASEHFDFIDPLTPNYAEEVARSGQRIVTFLLYLNDDYTGGETAMPNLDIAHKGRRGEGLFFVNALPNGDADTRTVHAGRAPTSGEKWIVSQFIRNRPTF